MTIMNEIPSQKCPFSPFFLLRSLVQTDLLAWYKYMGLSLFKANTINLVGIANNCCIVCGFFLALRQRRNNEHAGIRFISSTIIDRHVHSIEWSLTDKKKTTETIPIELLVHSQSLIIYILRLNKLKNVAHDVIFWTNSCTYAPIHTFNLTYTHTP